MRFRRILTATFVGSPSTFQICVSEPAASWGQRLTTRWAGRTWSRGLHAIGRTQPAIVPDATPARRITPHAGMRRRPHRPPLALEVLGPDAVREALKTQATRVLDAARQVS